VNIAALQTGLDAATLADMDEAVRKYMSEIGAKGGKANKGKASEKCRAAARARWAKHRAAQTGKPDPKKPKADPDKD
tara:strand:+ start:955 stop:1185 length:231 start_codon:yes stop_codon:yes gene_type:complete